jgi:glucose-1-phosphate thymidylyltransferase
VKAIILAAGYATRLRPLTDTIAKPLLPVGGRPMLDWILDRIEQVDDVDEIHVVTNARYASSFEAWRTSDRVTIHDDATTTNEDRLGAIGDIQFVIERAHIDDALLVIAGDNLFDFSLGDFVEDWRSKGEASAVALYDVGELELVKRLGVVDLDEDGRVTRFVEKPEHPTSTLAATASYIYHRAHLPLIERYLEEGNSPDQPGRLIAWLHTRAPVYGYRFEGEWFDIGDKEQLLVADNKLRARAGLPQRTEYAPE